MGAEYWFPFSCHQQDLIEEGSDNSLSLFKIWPFRYPINIPKYDEDT